MLTPKQSAELSGVRKTVAATRSFGPNEGFALRYSQLGLPFCPEFAAYLTVHLKEPGTLQLSQLQALAAQLEMDAQRDDYAWIVVLGVSFDLWRNWCQTEGLPLNPGLLAGQEELQEILLKHQPPYAFDGGELFFHVKARNRDMAVSKAGWILGQLDGSFNTTASWCTTGDSLHDGRIYGGRMLHGLISSVEPVGFSARAVIGDEFPEHKGGCFGLTQEFIHDWQQLSGMADNQLENLIGRDHRGNIIVNDDLRSHVRMVRVNDDAGINYRHVAQSQPFRNRTAVIRKQDGGNVHYLFKPQDRRPEIGPGKEEGVYQLSYTKSIEALTKVLVTMIGNDPGYIRCRHLNYSHADRGSFWYVPSAAELKRPAPHVTLTVPMNAFFSRRSENGFMFYNTKDYIYQLGNRTEVAETLNPQPSDRVVELLGYSFSRWHDTWYHRRPAPELGHLRDHLKEGEEAILKAPIAERKGYAVKRTLELLSSDGQGQAFDTYRIHPKELIVGVVPEYTLGSGFEAMHYLDEQERIQSFLLKVDESGAAGHNVPHYQRLVQVGVGGLLKDLTERHAGARDDEARSFFQSAIYAWEGVQAYLRNYAALAKRILSKQSPGSAADQENLEAVARRLEALSSEPPRTFLEAAQLVFSVHCCMHIAGESVSIGRLDQILGRFYDPSETSEEDAQEIIDCFWVKMDEKVLLNRRHFNDRLSRGSGAITYEGGDFPQGAALNQWVQQVTVGGSEPTDTASPADACNAVTLMCLRAARRLPLNAPCLSLRVHHKTPEDILDEAARCVLSGGGHPFLINDEKIVAALRRSGDLHGGRGFLSLADAREMVCDGCFESLIAGKSEFAFSYVPVPEAIEMALNRGRTYAAAGPVHISGLKASLRTKSPREVSTWEEFYGLFLEHYRYKLIDFYAGMLSRYGNLARICPSPLLSPLVDGCIERGRDLTAGGARYKLLAPLMNGMTTAIDSLWAIRDMVFSPEAVFSLPELVDGLICDWGFEMKEPFYSQSIGQDRITVQAERFKALRLYALSLPKFGKGRDDIDQFGRRVVQDLVTMAHDLVRRPEGLLKEHLDSLQDRYGTNEEPFCLIITPGIATFEDYAGVGSFLGASADGRRRGQAVGSDFSPSPSPPDLPVERSGRPARTSLRSWSAGRVEGEKDENDPIGIGLSNGAPIDVNIRESFSLAELTDLIREFAQGRIGSNMMSISCADPDTLARAQRTPEAYDLIRLRMGGWSEFFVAMFPHHQEQHKRRPCFEAEHIETL